MMCQRPDCVYVHPTFMNYLYNNSMKRKGGKPMPQGIRGMMPPQFNRQHRPPGDAE